jgi:hypothetical protein
MKMSMGLKKVCHNAKVCINRVTNKQSEGIRKFKRIVVGR